MVVRSKNLKTDGQHNGQTKKDENKTNNGWQTTAHKIEEWATCTSIVNRGELKCTGSTFQSWKAKQTNKEKW